ncbi:MAG: DUF2490 domain-containing protein [bacterium]
MKRGLGILFGLILLLTAAGLSAKENDFQLWTELKVSHTFGTSPWTLHWATENRFDQNVSNYLTFNTTLGFDYKILKWLKGGFFYRFEKTDGKPRENRIFPQFDLAHVFGITELSTRQRFEVRIFPNDTRFRYRSRFRFAWPIKTEPVSFKPFVSDELFFEPGHGGFDQNRFQVGNDFGFLKDKITFTLYYMLKSTEAAGTAGTPGGTNWTQAHVLGTSLGFKF